MLNQIRKQSGQSLVEVLVVLTLAIIIMVALVIVILTGLKNSQLAQSQTKATKYAQDAIEQITTLRDRDSTLKLTGVEPDPKFSYLYTLDFALVNTCISAKCYFKLGSDLTPSLQQISNFELIDHDLGDGGLVRQIYLENGSGADEKKLTVKVLWSDSSGVHESNLQTFLTKH